MIYFRRFSVKRISGIVLGFCITSLGILAYLSFDFLTIVDSFSLTTFARSNTIPVPVIITQLKSQLPTILPVIVIVFYKICLTRNSKTDGSWLSAHQQIIWMLLIFVSDSLLMLSNCQTKAMPLLGIFGIIFVGHIEHKLPTLKSRDEYHRHLFIMAMCFVLIAPQIAYDIIGLSNGLIQKYNPAKKFNFVLFTEPHLTPLILYDGSSNKDSNGSVYTNYVNNGVSLLREHCNPNDHVLTMDMVNPFPYALKSEPPRGGIAAIAFNYTLSDRCRPSFDAYFGDATVVMLPKHPAQIPRYIDGFYKIYIPALHERFQCYGESDYFWLYKRK